MSEDKTPYERDIRAAMRAIEKIRDVPAPEGADPDERAEHKTTRIRAIQRIEAFAEKVWTELLYE